MELAVIGLGRMGLNMVSRMVGKVNVHVWNRSPEKAIEAEKWGATRADTVEDLLAGLTQERKIVWLMLPSGKVTEEMFQKMLILLKKDDVLIDGANSNFKDTIRHYKEAEAKGIDMLDIGVSGGIVAATRGYPMMVGGKQEVYDFVKPILDTFGFEEGYNLVGPGGAGHYVKMVHNAIEYGMMQAIAEGFDLLKNGHFKDLQLKDIVHLWNHGTIVDSFLMQMTEQALDKDPSLDYLKPYVEDNGEENGQRSKL